MMSSSIHNNRKSTFRKGKSHRDNTLNHDTENVMEKNEEDISKSPHNRKHDLYSSGMVKRNTPSLKLCKKWLIGELKRVKKENLLLRSHLDTNTTDSTELVSIKQKLSQTLQKKCALRRKYKALLHIHKASLVELYNLAAAENDALRNDISLLGNVVQRLSEELEKYETEAGGQQKDPPSNFPSNKIIKDCNGAVVSKLRSRQELHIFAPLMAAYDSLLGERASLIAQYRSEATRLRSICKSVEDENEELRRRVVACESTRVTDVHRVETLSINKELLEEQNEVLIQKVHLFNTSLNLLLSKYERLEIRNLRLSRQNNSLERAAQLVRMRSSLQPPSEDSECDSAREPQGEIHILKNDSDDHQKDNVDTNKTILQLKRQILLLRERNAMLLKQNVEEHSECISKRVHENIVQYLHSMFDELTRKYRESNKMSEQGKEALEEHMENCGKVEEQRQSVENQRQPKKCSEQHQRQSKLLNNSEQKFEKSERNEEHEQALEQQKQLKKLQQMESREMIEKRQSLILKKMAKKSEDRQIEQHNKYQDQWEHSRMFERQQIVQPSRKENVFEEAKVYENQEEFKKFTQQMQQCDKFEKEQEHSKMSEEQFSVWKSLEDVRRHYKPLERQKRENASTEKSNQSLKLEDNVMKQHQKLEEPRRHLKLLEQQKQIKMVDQLQKLEDDQFQMIRRQQMFAVKLENTNKGEEKPNQEFFKTEERELGKHRQSRHCTNIKLELHRQNQPKNLKENLQHSEEVLKSTSERPILIEAISKQLEENRDQMKAKGQTLDQEKQTQNLGGHQQQRREDKASKLINQQRQQVQPKGEEQRQPKTLEKEDEEDQRQEQSDVQQFLYSRTRL